MRFRQAVCTISMIAAFSVSLGFTSEAAAQDTPVQLAQYPSAPYEDRHGNLWFGTVLEGLIRFDGSEFVTFTTENGLPSNMIRGILEADDDTLYIATSEGLVTYDGNSFTPLTQYEPFRISRTWNEQGDHLNLSSVMIDRNGDLWIATMDGVFKHDGNKFIRFPMPVTAAPGKSEFTPKKVSRIYEDQDANLWFATDGAGVIRYDGNSMTIFTSDKHGLASDNVSAILQDSKGHYWFGTANGGVSHYDGNTFTTHLREKEHSIHHGYGRFLSIVEDQQGNIWFGAAYSRGGVYRYNGTDFKHIFTESGLGNGGVPSIRQDRSGTLWLGTTAGVYHYDGDRFINFSKTNPQLPQINTQPDNMIEQWARETIELPPHFAPNMPTGVERLRFPPGWRDPESPNFWSYTLVMWIDEPPADARRIAEILEIYYDGLMSVFAHSKYGDVSIKPTRATVQKLADHQYSATMRLIDAFATFEPIEVNVMIETAATSKDKSTLSIRVSAQPTDHHIWASLQEAVRSTIKETIQETNQDPRSQED